MTGNNGSVLVLGASRGLGRGIAEALAELGFVVGAACRKIADSEDVARSIQDLGGQAVPLVADVARLGQIEAAVTRLREREPKFVGLVNNAGVIHPIGRIVDTDPQLWAQAIDANLVGSYHGVRAALPHLSRGGVVVNVSSGAASNPMEGWSAYCCSKAALAMLTKMIHHEYHQTQEIHAYGFRPGVVDTDMQGEIRASGLNPVSKLERSTLVPVRVPACAIAWLVATKPVDLAGQDLDVRDPVLQSRMSHEALARTGGV